MDQSRDYLSDLNWLEGEGLLRQIHHTKTRSHRF